MCFLLRGLADGDDHNDSSGNRGSMCVLQGEKSTNQLTNDASDYRFGHHDFRLTNPTGSVSTHFVETGASFKSGYQPPHLMSPARIFASVPFKKFSFAELNQKK